MATVTEFENALVAARLVAPDQLQAFWADLSADSQPTNDETFAELLIEAGLLTSFQARQLAAGRPEELTLADYVILDPIKVGRKGALFRARHVDTGAIVTLKVLGGKWKTAKKSSRFRREARALVALEHPHVLHGLDYGDCDGRQYLALEHVTGASLRSVLQSQGPLPVMQAVEYVVQAAKGLAYVHSRGYVHRDVQPRSLLLTQEGVVKVIEFSAVKPPEASAQGDKAAHGGSKSTSRRIGTIDYMAPEQAIDPQSADARSDIYGLACTLYRLLTGHRPYRGETDSEKIAAHRQEPLPSLRTHRRDASEALEAVLHRGLAKRPGDRYATMAEFAAALSMSVKSSRSTTGAIEAADEPSALMPPMHYTPPPSAPPPLPPPPSLPSPSAPPPAYAAMPPPAMAYGSGGAAPGMSMPMPPAAAPMRDSQPASRPLVRTGGSARRWGQTLGGITIAVVTVAANVGVYYAVVTYVGPQYDYLNIMTPPPAVTPLTAKQAGILQVVWAKHLGKTVETSDVIGTELVLIPPGEFLYGSPENDPSAADVEMPQRRIRITEPFYLGRHEVTQGQWRQVMTTVPWDAQIGVKDGADYPASYVTWNDATEFCKKLSQRTGDIYRLPTEAEWEHACRAATTTRFSHGNDAVGLGKYAWHFAEGETPERHAQMVGGKEPNTWRLHDMHGNLREWCRDWYGDDYYALAPEQNPSGPSTGTLRVLRGGAWVRTAELCRAASRYGQPPEQGHASYGFRVVREIRRESKDAQ